MTTTQDKEYLARRAEVVNNGKKYRSGEPIPYVLYSQEEVGTWTQVYRKLKTFHKQYAVKQVLQPYLGFCDVLSTF
jgi:hypothetical protein